MLRLYAVKHPAPAGHAEVTHFNTWRDRGSGDDTVSPTGAAIGVPTEETRATIARDLGRRPRRPASIGDVPLISETWGEELCEPSSPEFVLDVGLGSFDL